MMKKNIFMALAAIAIIAGATANVRLSESSTKAGIAIQNTKALSDNQTPGKGTRTCYSESSITANDDSSASYQICPPGGINNDCPEHDIRGSKKDNAISNQCYYNTIIPPQ
jgi:hypothetical protein